MSKKVTEFHFDHSCHEPERHEYRYRDLVHRGCSL